MGFHEVQFPTDISYRSAGGPMFSTSKVIVDSGQEERAARWSSPKYQYNVAYGIKSYTQLRSVYEFYIARLGPAYGFRYKDFFDFTSASDHTSAPANDDVQIGTGDGTEVTFEFVKKYSDAGATRSRRVFKLVSGTVLVAVAAAAKTEGTDYTIDYNNGTVTLNTAPTSGQAVTVGFEFDVPVVFAVEMDDSFLVSLDAYDTGSVPDIILVEDKSDVAFTGEFYYGGAYDWGSTPGTPVDITASQGRVHYFDSTTAVTVRLPVADDLAPGGPYFYIIQNSTGTLSIYDSTGVTLIGTITSGTGGTVILAEDSGVKEWCLI